MPTTPYTLKHHARSRSVKLSIHRDGRVVVTAPKRVSKRFVDAFVREKEAWIKEKLAGLEKLPHVLSPAESRAAFEKLKADALARVTKALFYYNTFYNFSWKKVGIRNQKSRWGSCSSRGSLNFNYRLAELPIELVDYVVVHELCHLKEMNHSPRFWALVEQTLPDARDLRRQLKKYSLSS